MLIKNVIIVIVLFLFLIATCTWNQRAERAGGLGIIRGKKGGESE